MEENLCSKVTWDPTLVFQCEDTSGEEYSTISDLLSQGRLTNDIGDARGQLLNCLRFAIELGAGIILPWVGGAPDAEALRRGTGRLAPFFDEPSFRANIATACPQLILYDTMEAVKRRGKVVPLPELSFNDVQRGKSQFKMRLDSDGTDKPKTVMKKAYSAMHHNGLKILRNGLEKIPRKYKITRRATRVKTMDWRKLMTRILRKFEC